MMSSNRDTEELEPESLPVSLLSNDENGEGAFWSDEIEANQINNRRSDADELEFDSLPVSSLQSEEKEEEAAHDVWGEANHKQEDDDLISLRQVVNNLKAAQCRVSDLDSRVGQVEFLIQFLEDNLEARIAAVVTGDDTYAADLRRSTKGRFQQQLPLQQTPTPKTITGSSAGSSSSSIGGKQQKHNHQHQHPSTLQPTSPTANPHQSLLTGGSHNAAANRHEKKLPEDTFSFMIVSPSRSQSFFLSLAVFFLQMLTFILVAINMIDINDKKNPLMIPTNVSPAVRITQLLSILVAVTMQNDLLTCFDLIKDGNYRGGLRIAFPHFSKAKFSLASTFRFFEGSLSLILIFILIISSDDVIALLLSFTALEFVSLFDEAFFSLAQRGFLGGACEKEASIVTKTTYFSPEVHTHRFRKMLLMALLFVALCCGWGSVIYKQKSGEFLCSTIMVQFGDDMIPTLGAFSGLYDKKTTGSRGLSSSQQRVEYVERRSQNAKFAYCDTIEAWTFRWQDSTSNRSASDDDEDYDPCDWIARSSQTGSYDVTQNALDRWYIQDKYQREIVLEPFFLSCFDCDDSDNQCKTCDDAVCTCDDDRFGPRCEFTTPCPTLSIDATQSEFPLQYVGSEKFELLYKNSTNGDLVIVYDRPVYVNTSRSGSFDVIFFTGRRWATTYAFRMPEVQVQENENETKTFLGTYFETEFHAHWSKYSVEFLSDAMDQGTKEDANSPVGLPWRFAEGSVSDSGMQGLGSPIETKLVCAFCNQTNPCLYDGVCQSDGSCECSPGSEGVLCEVTPVGNGRCDPFFNTPEFGLDGGDCCDSTCVSTEKNVCGRDESGYYSSGYFLCALPTNEWRLNGSPMVGGNRDSFLGKVVALSRSGNVLVAAGLPIDGFTNIQVYDKDGSEWSLRASFELQSFDSLEQIQIAEHGTDLVSNPEAKVEITLACSSDRYVSWVLCKKDCEVAADEYTYDPDGFDLAPNGMHAFVYKEIDNDVRILELPDEGVLEFNYTPGSEKRVIYLGDFERVVRRVRLSEDGGTVVQLYFELPDFITYVTAHSWNGTAYQQAGSSIRHGLANVYHNDNNPLLVLSGNGEVFAVSWCDSNALKYRLDVFAWNETEAEWLRRESPPVNEVCLHNTFSLGYYQWSSFLKLSQDGSILAHTSGYEQETESDASASVYRWTEGGTWELIGQPLKGGRRNFISLSGDGLTLALGSPIERGDNAGLVYVYSRPSGKRFSSGCSFLRLSVFRKPSAEFVEAGKVIPWVLFNRGTTDLIGADYHEKADQTRVVDLVLEDVDSQCYVFRHFADEWENLPFRDPPGGYALFLNGTQLRTEMDGLPMKQVLIGNCTEAAERKCMAAEAIFQLVAVLKDNNDNVTWRLEDHATGDPLLVGGFDRGNELRVIEQDACLDLTNSCFVFSLENGYMPYDRRSFTGGSVGLYLNGAELDVRDSPARGNLYFGDNDCCPAGTFRAQYYIRACGKAAWTFFTTDGALFSNGNTIDMVDWNSAVDYDSDCDSFEAFREDRCFDSSQCYFLFLMDGLDYEYVDSFISDWEISRAYLRNGQFFGNCSDFSDEFQRRNTAGEPIWLSDGIPLQGQASSSVGTFQEYRLTPVTVGDNVTCTMEGNNGQANLLVGVSGTSDIIQSYDCASAYYYEGTYGTNASCTVIVGEYRSYDDEDKFVRAVVFTFAPYTDATITCSIQSIASNSTVRHNIFNNI